MAKKIDTAMNVLGAAAAVTSFLNLNTKPPGNSKMSKFYASLKHHHIVRTNKFEVLFGLPKILSGYSGSESHNLLHLRCENASVPGVTVGTAEVQRYGYGLSEKVPTGATMGDLTCSFIADDEGLIQKLFYRWTNGIVKWDGRPSLNSNVSYTGNSPYEFEYKDNYQTDLQLITYNENEDKIMSYQFFEAFPISVGEIQYNWGDTDNLVRLPIVFAYSHYKIMDIDEDVAFKPGVDNSLGLIGSLVKVGTAVQTFASLKKPRSVGDAINIVNNAKIVIGNLKL